MRAIHLPASIKVILMYLMLTYCVPGALMAALNMWPDYYKATSSNPLAIVCVILSIGLAFMVIGRLGMAKRYSGDLVKMRLPSSGAQTILLILLVMVALVAFADGKSSWRYSNESLSDLSSPLLYLFAMIPLVLRAFVLVYVMLDQAFGTRPADKLRSALVIIGLFLSANGNVTMIIAFASTLMLLFLHYVRRSFGVELHGSYLRASFLKLLAQTLLLFMTLAMAWLLGETVKRDQTTAEVLEWLFDRNIVIWLTEMLVGRSSPSYVSALFALEHYAFNLDWSVLVEHLAAPISSFLFRLQQLLSLDILSLQRPEAGSIMRINYLMITPFPFNEREGTSPGLVAGFIYSFPFPLNFAALSLYLIFVAWIIDGLARAIPGRLTATGTLAMLMFVLPLFESPIDFLLIIDEGTIYLIILLALRWASCRATNRTKSLPMPKKW